MYWGVRVGQVDALDRPAPLEKNRGARRPGLLELQEIRRSLVSWFTRAYVACKTASIYPPFWDPDKVIGDEIVKINFQSMRNFCVFLP
jgi:hypothetical protein